MILSADIFIIMNKAEYAEETLLIVETPYLKYVPTGTDIIFRK